MKQRDTDTDEIEQELRRKIAEWRRKANEGIGPHSRGEIHIYEKNADELEEILERHTGSESGP